MHYLRNMLSDAMAAVIVRWGHCKKQKSNQTFEQVNITDTPKNMKLNCIPIAEVDFWIRVRPTFIYFFHYFFFLFFSSIRNSAIRLCIFDACVCLPLSHFVCCLTCQKQKQKTSNRFQSKCYSPCCCHGIERERKKKYAFTLYNNVYEQLLLVWSNVETIRVTVWKVFEYLHSFIFVSSHLRCSAGLVGCGWCVNRYRGYLISFQLDRHSQVNIGWLYFKHGCFFLCAAINVTAIFFFSPDNCH